jgi:hypothetical protein
MNELLEKIKDDLFTAMKIEIICKKDGSTHTSRFDNAIAQKTVSRAIISMIPELGKKPDKTTVEDIQKLIKKYVKNEKERQLYIQKYIKESDVDGISPSQLKQLVNDKIQEAGTSIDTLNIIIAESYLPKQASEEEISAWIDENIDFSQYKNKMQAMGPIMKQFQGADGNFVKNILLKY